MEGNENLSRYLCSSPFYCFHSLNSLIVDSSREISGLTIISVAILIFDGTFPATFSVQNTEIRILTAKAFQFKCNIGQTRKVHALTLHTEIKT